VNVEKYKAVRVVIGRDPNLGSSPSHVARRKQLFVHCSVALVRAQGKTVIVIAE
jgi:hypothetical protein